MTLATVTDKLKSADHKWLSRVVVLLLVVYLLSLLANIVWKLIPEPVSKAKISPQTIQQQAGQTSVTANVSAIKSLNLFGQLGEQELEAPVQQEEVKLTRLNLKLSGVVATEDPAKGAAIIEKSGKQSTYGVNDKIEGTRAILKEIYADKVILVQGGVREALMLEGSDATTSTYVAPSRPKSKATNPNRVEKRRASAAARQARAEIKNNPGKITDYVRISPVRDGGKMKGYRLMPGRTQQVFMESGLRPNDLAIEINGQDLTNPANAMTALRELNSSQQISITVLRNDQPVSIEFSIPDGDRENQ